MQEKECVYVFYYRDSPPENCGAEVYADELCFRHFEMMHNPEPQFDTLEEKRGER